MRLSIIVPTFNEAPNVAEVVRRVAAAVGERNSELIFVDDSTDNTPDVIAAVASESEFPVRLIHRAQPEGGLSGAVLHGMTASKSDWCVVMDGDLQHPPELIPLLLDRATAADADIAVASRYCHGGNSSGLAGPGRKAVSHLSGTLARGLFPQRLRGCTDPMTGFFAVRRASIDVAALRPRGFKILLEILATHTLRVVEEPFTFGERVAGSSKANLTQGGRFLMQLAELRFGRVSRFAAIGAIGAVANLIIMGVLLALSMNYLAAAMIAAAVTILANFVAQERFVFHDLRDGTFDWRARFASVVGMNSFEAVARLPILAALVEFLLLPSLVAQALTLGAAFFLRYFVNSRVIYRPRGNVPVPMAAFVVDPVEVIEDEQAA